MKIQHISLSTSDKIALISNMQTMLASGIPILETIDSLLEDAKGGQKKLLTSLRDDLGQGQHMYYTFSRFPNIFDKVTVNIIKAAEEAGTLDEALKEIKENTKKEVEFNNRIKSALIYPMFIVVVFLAVLLLILVVVVPKIATVFSRLHVSLPLPTQILIFLSDLVLQQTIPLLFGLTVFIGVMIFLYKRSKKTLINLLTSLPLISTLARQIDLTRFSRSLYLLLNAGLPITTALEFTQEIVVKKEIYKAVKHAKEEVFAGKRLSQGLKDYKNLIPGIMIKMIESGERSGTLDKSLQEVSDYLDGQVSNTLRTLTALMEPLLLVLIGVMVGGMMLAIIAPIYGLIGQVGPQ
ncbi:MAG: type II secretion system F family protein [Patescibacteria group bacterium]